MSRGAVNAQNIRDESKSCSSVNNVCEQIFVLRDVSNIVMLKF